MFDDDTERDDAKTPEPPDPMSFVAERAYAEHPLFPTDTGKAETRDIRFVTFRRRRPDGRIDNCPEDIPADSITSWAEVVGPWGGGEYKAIGKDKNHKIVAWHPTEQGGWVLFDQPSKPFTLRDERRYSRGVVEAPASAPPVAPPAPPAAAPAPTPLEGLVAELIREIRGGRAAPAASMDGALVAMINQSAETNRTVLSAMLTPRPAEQPRQEPTAFALELMRAMREWLPPAAPVVAPAAPQASMPEQLGTLKTLLELTRPGPAAPEASILGELGGLVTTVMQTDAAARATQKASEPTEHRQLPPRTSRVVHVPGLGVVDVLQPEPPPSVLPVRPEQGVDLDALKRDPAAVAKLLHALGITASPNAVAPATVAAVAAADSAAAPAPVPLAPTDSTVAPAQEAPSAASARGGASAPPARVQGQRTRAAVEPLLPAAAQAVAPVDDRSPGEPSPVPAVAASPAATEVPRPAAPNVLRPRERVAIALPAQMPTFVAEPEPTALSDPTAPAPSTTTDEREHAARSLGTLSGLPPDELRAQLKKVPGLAPHADDLAMAIADMPPQAIAMIVGRLPAEHVRGLSALMNGKGG